MVIILCLIIFLVRTAQIESTTFTNPAVTNQALIISENTAANTNIASMLVTSPTIPVTWTTSGTHAAKYSISVSTGDTRSAFLQLATALDYETIADRATTVVITATDSSATPLAASVTFQVTLTNVYDVSPIFASDPYTCNIEEESTASSCTSVSVSDAETTYSPNPDAITCTLSGTNSDLFDPNSPSCQIRPRNAIDRDIPGATTSFPNIKITATDKGGKSSTALISVTLTDINDNAPVCTQNIKKTISETFIGTIVDIPCSDADDIANQIGTCTSTTTGYTFTFASGFCKVVNIIAINYETIITNPFEILVVTEDKPAVPNKKYFTSTLTIQVYGVNDNNPVWTVASLANPVSTILESATLNTPVFSTAATDADKDIGNSLTYTIFSALSDTNLNLIGSFLIDSTGLVTVSTANLDREQYSTVIFDVRVSDGTNGLTRTATVSISDVNELKPVFTPSNGYYSVNIPERSVADTEVKTLTVIDPDASNSPITCTITNGNGDSVFKMDAANAKKILLNKALDVDKPSSLPTSYNILVECKDALATILTSTATLSVGVTLTNNEAPNVVATKAITVPENQASGLIGTITATDNDAGNDGVLECSIDGGSVLFEITNCADIRLIGTLDYETLSSHTFTITVKDKGATVKSSTCVVTVTVTNVNDNAPICTKSSQTISLVEQAKPATPLVILANIPCSDADEATSNLIIASGNTGSPAPFSLNNKDLQLNELLDYETITAYTLQIEYRENVATGARTATIMVYVNVLPVNENTPVFTTATVTKAENLPISTVITTFTAVDNDKGGHGIQSYSLVDNFLTFTINNNGEVVLISAMDYEKIQTYTLVVKAVDGGSTALTGTGTLTIIVTDINDNSPQCSQSLFTKSIAEDLAVSTNVVAIAAKDEDGSTPNNQLFYKLVTNPSSFEINAASGQITTGNPTNLNYELISSYTLLIEVKDLNGGVGALSTTCTAAITITDVNLYTPVFSPSTAATVNVKEDQTSGSKIFTRTATDSDTKQTLSYSYTPSGLPFSIDSSGNVYTSGGLNFESTELYALVIKVEDNGSPIKSATYSLTVQVVDVNEFAPTCDSSTLKGTVNENSAVSTALSSITCTDQDTTKVLSYKISPTNTSPFKMSNAEVQVGSATLDYETTTTYDVIIDVEDNLATAKTTTVTYKVTIGPVNEHAPVFVVPTSYILSIPENEAVNNVISTYTANDADKGSNHWTVTYSLTGGNTTFTIDPINGKLTLIKALDYEVTKTYTDIVLKATDGGSLFGTMSITVSVTDINDNAPTGTPNPLNQNVAENAAVGSLVKDLTSSISDIDSSVNNNNQITVSIKSGNTNNYFRIAGKTVEVNTSPMSLTLYPTIELILQLTDGGTPALSSELKLIVAITEVNEHTPTFTATAPYVVSISEDIAVGDAFFTATALDNDGNQLSGTIEYSIGPFHNGSGMFTVDPINAKVRVRNALDRDVPPSSYTLEIIAKDKGTASKSSSMTLTISLLDVNDNNPVFNTPIATDVSIDENMVINTPVVTFGATDIDNGVNATVLYYIDSQSIGNYFALNPNTGQLTTAAVIDRETYSSFSLRIRAEDGGTPKRSAYKDIKVTINDLNDNYPVFNPNTTVQASITENQAAGQVVATMPATDRDSALFGLVTYTLKQVDANSNVNYFSIDSSGKITTTQQLNREAVSKHSIYLEAKDGGSPSLSATRLLEVNVMDVNDNDPVITLPNPMTFNVNENSDIDTVVGTVVASDPDAGENATLTYIISTGNTNNEFKISNSLSGLISVNAKIIDYEATKVYTLLVNVKDGGAPSRTSTATVTISINDVNDNACQFGGVIAYSTFTMSVKENSPINTFIGTLVASDADTGANAVIRYALGRNILESGLAFFQINDVTAAISTKATVLDRENIPRYIFTVLCFDQTASPLTSTVTLTLDVTDVNDNVPNQVGNYTELSVYENVPVNYAVIRFNTTDRDIGNNSQVVYLIDTQRLDGTRVNQLFMVQATTGLMSTRIQLDRETDAVLQFYVIARDQGNTSLSSSIFAKINILDINDNAPVFTKTFYSLEVAYNITTGYSIGSVLAIDRDQGQNAAMLYRWQSTVSHYSLDTTTGSLSRKPTVTLYPYVGFIYLIQAVDQGAPSLTGSTTVRIDTFDPAKQVVLITISSDTFANILSTFLSLLGNTLISRYPNNRVTYMYTVNSVTGSSVVAAERQLLASQTQAYFYAIADTKADTAAGVALQKNFISNTELLALWRSNADGTPTQVLLSSAFGNITVVKVQSYILPATAVEQWYQTAWGIAVIVLSCALFLTLLGLLIGCLVYKKKKTTRVDDTRRYLITNERDAVSNTPKPAPLYKMENQENRTKTANVSNPIYRDSNPYGVGPQPQIQIDRLTEPSGQLASDRIITPVDVNI